MTVRYGVCRAAPYTGELKGPYEAVEGKLYEQGKVVGSFTARRVTKTGYRLCEALDKDVRVIGVDILKWLREPQMNSSLGNI